MMARTPTPTAQDQFSEVKQRPSKRTSKNPDVIIKLIFVSKLNAIPRTVYEILEAYWDTLNSFRIVILGPFLLTKMHLRPKIKSMKSISVTSKINGKRMKALRCLEGSQMIPAARRVVLHSALARWEFDVSNLKKTVFKRFSRIKSLHGPVAQLVRAGDS